MNETPTLKTKTKPGGVDEQLGTEATDAEESGYSRPAVSSRPVGGEHIRFQTSEIVCWSIERQNTGGRVVCGSVSGGGGRNNVHNVLTSTKGAPLRLPTDTKTSCVHAQGVLNNPSSS